MKWLRQKMTQHFPNANSSLPWLAGTCTWHGTEVTSPVLLLPAQRSTIAPFSRKLGSHVYFKRAEVSWSVLSFLCWQFWVLHPLEDTPFSRGAGQIPVSLPTAVEAAQIFCPFGAGSCPPPKDRTQLCRALGCKGAGRAGISEK